MYRKCDFKYSTVLFHVAFLMLWEHAFTQYIENLGVIIDSTFRLHRQLMGQSWILSLENISQDKVRGGYSCLNLV